MRSSALARAAKPAAALRSWPSRQGMTRLKSTRAAAKPSPGTLGASSQPRSTSGSSATISGLPANADGLWYGESPGPTGVVGNHCHSLCPADANQSTKR